MCVYIYVAKDRQTDWLAGRLDGWLAGWLVGWLFN